MADKRMLAKAVILSDPWLDMPADACKLYTVLNMLADDQGVIGNPKSAVRLAQVPADALNVLYAKKFLLPLDNGIALIKHWKINNYLRKDTFHESTYQEELQAVRVKSDKSYSLKPGPKPILATVENPVENYSAT